jgi:hypothetical protein
MVLFFLLFFEVKIPDPVRAGNNAIPATNAPAEVLYYDAILTTIGCLSRTYRNTWRFIAVHARHRYQVNS